MPLLARRRDPPAHPHRPGGTGKTRLALHAAAESARRLLPTVSTGSRWLPLRDPAHALSTIAQALEIQEQPPAPLQDTLREALTGRNCLLVLDNAEHLLPALADDVAALREAPGPTFLVTSRERLDLQAERLYPVPSLEGSDAVALFNDRASYVDPEHDPDDPAIGPLCERLDSLPLALELAAARSDLYHPRELLVALDGHLDLLKGARDHDPRHQTLTATIAWSYDLLAPDEQSRLPRPLRLLRRRQLRGGRGSRRRHPGRPRFPRRQEPGTYARGPSWPSVLDARDGAPIRGREARVRG